MANVFISHSSIDAVWSDQIYGWLKEEGHEVFLDRDEHDGIIVGDDWERRLYEQLRRADAVVCVVSEAYVESVWCAGEIGAARALGSELLPVVVSPDSERHKLLKTIQAVDAAKDPVAARKSLLDRLRVIDGGGGWGWPDGQSPYPGLRSFELGDHRVFFGRSREITSIAERLRSPERAQPAILAVVGPSGCGKSSLVRAGVLPRIAGEGYWLTAPPIVPGADPLGNLVRSIAALVREKNIPVEVGSLRTDIEREGLKAVANDLLVAAGVDTKCKLLIVIDQFEELITQTEADERAKFAATLGPSIGGPVQVLATLRPEFLEPVSKDADLRKLPLRLRQINPLDSDALREVIEQPAKVAGLSFEDDLVTRLIADTDGGEALPLLAFTLEQLAAGLSRGGRLTHRCYDDIGGVRGALERQADEALADACSATGMAREKVMAELLDLVTFDEQNRPSKRRLVLDETSAMTALEPFLQRRLLSTEEASGNTTLITVSHEAFLVNWPPLKQEIDNHVDALRARHMIEDAAHDWVDGGREATDLLDGGRLTKAMVDTDARFEPVAAGTEPPADARAMTKVPRWRRGRRLATRVDLDDSAEEYLQLSADADRARKTRAKQKRAGLMALLLVITLAAVSGALWAIDQQGRAESSERDAIAESLIAQSRVSLAKGVDKSALQQLLAGRRLKAGASDTEFYPMLVNAASTYKIIENPPVAPGEATLVPVQSVAFSPDGGSIAAANDDHTVRVWDAGSGSLIHLIKLTGEGTEPVSSVAFDAAGKRIAAGSGDGSLQVFNAQSGDRIGSPMLQPKVNSVAFGHGDQWIATGDSEGTVRVWNAARGEVMVTIPPPVPDTMVRTVAFSPTADLVASGGNDYQVRLWDARSGREVATPRLGGYPVMSMAFDKTGERLVVGRVGGTIEVLNGRTLERIGQPFQAYPNFVNSVAFSTDGSRIVSGGDDNTVKVWDATTHAPYGNPMRGHRGAVTSVAFNDDGMRIVSGSLDGSVREWDAVVGLSIPANQGNAIRAVGFSPDNQTMASGGSDGTVKLWDSRTAAFIKQLGVPSAPQDTSHGINSLAFNRDGSRVVTAASDGRVSVWDTGSGELVKDLRKDEPPGGPPIPNAKVSSVAYDGNGERIVAGGFDGLVRLWNADTLLPIGMMRAQKEAGQGKFLPYQVWSVAFSPDGRRIVTGSGFDTAKEPNYLIQVWRADALTPEGEPLRGPQGVNVNTVGFDSTGDHIVSGSSDGAVRVWDVANRKDVDLAGDQNPVLSIALAHGSQWIAAGGSGGIVRVWDMVDQPPSGTPLEGHLNWVHSVAFSPDDKVILSGSADGNLKLWPAPTDVGEAICSKLTTNMSHEQWKEWVRGKLPYENLCPELDIAPDL